MALIKSLPCCVCEEYDKKLVFGVECHHIVNGYRLGDLFCLPLCYKHHRGEYGFSGSKRDESWDMSLENQLRLHKKIWKKMGLEAPEYTPKRANTSFHKQLWEE